MWPISITNATGFADILQKYVNSAHFDQKLFDNLLWNHLAKLYQTLLGWSHFKNVVALVMGISHIFKIDDSYTNIEQLSIIGDNYGY